ncbi:MAG: selenoneine biosynthesis selenosugar synthase SenB [Rubrivivax sp.]|nr:selenoneine biosynthesis selenosugar synthase SenB [Rubrivivax sp.]MDP3611309.1 selenoneine biosynthesis selenosugar synthase SenB [Rubrivivax sp.]
MTKPDIVLVTPALADANNGNWRTAQRWARLLRADYRVRLAGSWAPGQADGPAPAAMIALHARRSAAAIQAWRAAFPQRLLVVVLTGTDLYRDIATDADAQRSLQLADRLVVLNELGLQALPAALRAKASVCLQSSPARLTLPKSPRHLRALMVGHLREEKCPQTYLDAAARLAHRRDIRLDHIGSALDLELGAAAQACARQVPTYRWLGGLTHAVTRRHIQRAHVLVHPSRMEGGAQVVIEAITSGTPVLASRIDGNLGLLGADYGGSFDVGDSAALAALLQRCRDDAAMLPALQAQCDLRAALFSPAHERQTLLNLLAPQLA